MGKIITGGEANDLIGRIVFSDSSRCPTYNALITNGFVVTGSYANNQLVDKAAVAAGGLNPIELTATVNWSLNTSSMTQSISEVFHSEYYIEFKADNADDDELRYDNAIKIKPNDLQHTGHGTGTFKFAINDETRNIIATVWCYYPSGWYGTDFHWSTFELHYGNQISRAASFVNQYVVSDGRLNWTYGEDDAREFVVNLNLTAWVSGQTYGMQSTTFKQEINKILNDGKE